MSRAKRRPDLRAYEHFLAGRALLHRRDSAGALAELQRAIEIDPDFAEAHAEWAISRLIGNPSSTQLDAARAAIDRALALQPKLLRAQAAQGFLLLASNPPEPAAAEATLRGVLQEDPNMSDALLWLGNSLAAQGRNDDALGVLQRAVRIDPLHPSITANLALQLIWRGQDREGIQVLENEMRQPNPGYGPFLILCDVYRGSGRLVELNAVVKVQSLRGIENYYGNALSYGLLGDWRTAQYWLDRTVRDFPQYGPEVYLSAVPGWQGHHGEALQRFRQTLAANQIDIAGEPGFFQLWYGALLARAGEHAAAIEQLERVVHPTGELLSQTGPEPQLDGPHALAWSYLQTGANAKAKTLLSGLWQQCQVKPADGGVRNGEFLHYCAETALLSGDVDAALAWLARAVAAGWRDYYLRLNDPYWAALKDDPRFQAQMEIVRKDVARQRAEIERIDAADDFVAKVDAAMAARKSAKR